MTKILTIDDEREFTDMIVNYFEPRGYEVFFAHDGDTGLAIAKKEQPEVALVDLKMPGKHGDEVLKLLKVVSPKTKVIMITASEGEGKIRETLVRSGAMDCFDKPIASLKELEAKVKEASRL